MYNLFLQPCSMQSKYLIFPSCSYDVSRDDENHFFFCLYQEFGIRCTMFFHNHDLCKVNILSSTACCYGAPQDDTNHFFFACTRNSEIRNGLSIVIVSDLINTSLLTLGSGTLSYADTCFIFLFSSHFFDSLKGLNDY